jgi:phenylpropionate dioxygenase-like ring-hydroxylating dioxygenase large terminal subunit
MVIERTQLIDTERGLLDRSIYSSKEIYQEELEKIFGRAWLLIGHDSLVPNPNDFFLTYMGEDPVIVTRDAKGEVHAFLNMCMHRGNRVARADDGNAKNFMCTYHGWTYSNEGKLVSVPGLQEAYYGELDVDKLGLVSVAQIDTYAGLIFATWDSEAPGLEDYIGDLRWYMDIMFNRREGGVELIGPDKWIGRFNWKNAADNFAGDSYHTVTSHVSAQIAQAKGAGRTYDPSRFFAQSAIGHGISFGNGHGTTCYLPESEEKSRERFNQQYQSPVLRSYRDEILPEMEQRLGRFRAYRPQNSSATLFPNLSWLWGNGTVRIWHPRGPDTVEIWSFVAVDKAAPEEVKTVTRRQSMLNFGPSGMFEQDDMDNWRQCTLSGQSMVARQYPHDLTMGLGNEIELPELPGQLIGHAHLTETPQRGMYAQWQAFIDAKSWKDIPVVPPTATYEGTATFKG